MHWPLNEITNTYDEISTETKTGIMKWYDPSKDLTELKKVEKRKGYRTSNEGKSSTKLTMN